MAVTSQPGSGVEIRTMVIEDAEFAGRMSVEAFQDKFTWAVGQRNFEKVIRGSQDSHKLLGSEYNRIFVATSNGERAGVVYLKFHDSQEPSESGEAFAAHLGCWATTRLMCLGVTLGSKVSRVECYVEAICCDAKFRGQGIGKKLLDFAEVEANRRGCNLMSLHVTTTNRARNLYERQGYEITKTEDGCCVSYCAMGIRKFYKMEKHLPTAAAQNSAQNSAQQQ